MLHPSNTQPIGLGLSGIDAGLTRDFTQLQLPTIQSRTNTTRTSFSFEKYMASMKIDADSTTSPVGSEPEFNSLYDLDVQYPSSRSLSHPSPQSALNYSYSPLSPTWSLDSILSPSVFSSPEETPLSSPNIRFPASWSSSSKLSISHLLSSSPAAPNRTPDMALPIADINMFRAPTSVQDFNSSVNPAYITLAHPPLSSVPSFPEFKPTQFVHYYPDGSHSSPLVNTHSTNSSQIKCDSPYLPYAPTPIPDIHPTFEVVIPIFTAIAGASPSRPRAPKRKAPAQDGAAPKKKEKKDADPEQFVLMTPVLDAHRGITQAELEAKAARYRQHNPGVEEFDKRWLASFSGQLTAMGEMIDDFRCYVVGCTQVNKRRDHMVVHVGSHLDQRKFKCGQCPNRYRRNNELKRHERTHEGLRPFVCPFCPASAKGTFKRQDLLKRHIKTQHEKENVNPRNEIKV
ncbi:hypothetical protein K438DRAFT_1958535 [Mycena galopus ATCC 62051]|nr:hypothetical protein K438DRAFT_1958535 [Mycena galopus ATCC 62051]